MDNKTVTQLVQRLFAYPEGQYVLEWLEDLYQNYTFRYIVQSESRNASIAMAYKAGQSDLVVMLKEIIRHGLPDDKPTTEGEEYARGNDDRGSDPESSGETGDED